jgi:hypothetical protein
LTGSPGGLNWLVGRFGGQRGDQGGTLSMNKLICAAVLGALCLAPLAASAGPAEWTGFVTDTHCGNKGATKDHTADCVQKCIKGGSKPQLWNDADQKGYNLDNFDKVKALMGGKVTVQGTLDPATNTIKVESAARADDKPKADK